MLNKYVIACFLCFWLGFGIDSVFSNWKNEKLEAQLSAKKLELVKIEEGHQQKVKALEADNLSLASQIDEAQANIVKLENGLGIYRSAANKAAQRRILSESKYEEILQKANGSQPVGNSLDLVPVDDLSARASRIFKSSN